MMELDVRGVIRRGLVLKPAAVTCKLRQAVHPSCMERLVEADVLPLPDDHLDVLFSTRLLT